MKITNAIKDVMAWRSKSLQFEVQRMVMGLLTILVLSYSFALLYYFTAGLNIASNVGFDALLKYNQSTISKLANDENDSIGFTKVDKYNELPKYVKELFPKNEVSFGIPQIKFNTDSHNPNTHLIFFLAEKHDKKGNSYIFKELGSNTNSFGSGGISLDILEHAIFIGGGAILFFVYIISKLITHNIRFQIRGLQEWAEKFRTLNSKSISS